jgi:hypothetical protein
MPRLYVYAQSVARTEHQETGFLDLTEAEEEATLK